MELKLTLTNLKRNDGRKQEWMQENNKKNIALVFITNNFIRKVARKSCEYGLNKIWGKFSKYKALVMD